MEVILNRVEHLIPQKQPFVMIDKLLFYHPTKVTSNLLVTSGNIFVDNERLQEPGIIENMAQTVALHTGYAYHLKNEPTPTGYLGSIKKIDIYQLPRVGTTIVSKAEILQEFNGVFLVEVSVFDAVNDLCAHGQFKTVIARS